MTLAKRLVHTPTSLGVSLGLLALRVGVGLLMAFAHGWGKIQRLLEGGEIQWADPIGLGMGTSLFLAGMAEFFCSLVVVLGLLTRLAVIPPVFVMSVAVFVVHAADPFQKQELGLLYLVAYTALFFAGAGRFSVDAWLAKRGER